MKILESRIDWNEAWDNHPNLKVTVDKVPQDEMVYRTYRIPGHGTLYVSDNTEFVAFLLHSPNDESGYGGRSFTLKMEDGSEVTIRGPWSSNSTSVYQITNGEVDCHEVYVCETESDYPNSYCHGYALRADVYKGLVEENGGFIVHQKNFRNVISMDSEVYSKPRRRKNYETGEEYTEIVTY